MTAGKAWVNEVLSAARFAPYLSRTDDDFDAAIHLYQWNLDVSSAFYIPLHCLEIGLRNAVHRRLAEWFGQPDWWTHAQLRGKGPTMVRDALRAATSRVDRAVLADDVVTELHFGFWVSLLSKGYDRSLWVPSLHAAFPHYRGRRDVLHERLNTMRLLRNRIMHHEPIHHRDLAADHHTALSLVGYLSPSMVTELESFDRVPAILRRRPNGSRP